MSQPFGTLPGTGPSQDPVTWTHYDYVDLDGGPEEISWRWREGADRDFEHQIALVDHIRILGSLIKADIRENVISCRFSAGFDAVTEVAMTVLDPQLRLIRDGVFAANMTVDFIGYAMRIAGVGITQVNDQSAVVLKLRSAGIDKLQNVVGPYVKNNISSTDYIKGECQTVWQNVGGSGPSFFGQQTMVRYQVARDVPVDYNVQGEKLPNAWSTAQRLADEEGFFVFEFFNTVYYGKPTWLIAHVPGDPFIAAYTPGEETEHSVLEVPECNSSDDSPDGETISVKVPISRFKEFPGPGRKFILQGIPGFDNTYIISNISFDMLDPNAVMTIEAQKPIDPKIYSTPSQTDILTYPGQERKGTKRAADFVAWALAQAGDEYVFGAGVNFNDNDPDQFDCSALVQWALNQVGIRVPRTTYTQWPFWRNRAIQDRVRYLFPVSIGARVRGALLYNAVDPFKTPAGFGPSPTHVAISLGDGKTTIEARSRALGVTRGEISAGWTVTPSSSEMTGGRFQTAVIVPDLVYTQQEFDIINAERRRRWPEDQSGNDPGLNNVRWINNRYWGRFKGDLL